MARARKRPAARRVTLSKRTLDARPDTVDFRDHMFVPTLIEVPTTRPLAEYRRARVPILDQGTEGACTGFGLAAVIQYLLRTRKAVPDRRDVSPRMLYDMARRYDEWPGERYSGSSARGAMKGWHKHGVCSSDHWRYHDFDKKQDNALYAARYQDALRRPLGAYFRVNHKDIIAMHAAMSEVGILYATAQVHAGWGDVGADGVIDWTEDTEIQGGHAFAIVAYDERGLWIQNSWADDWGKDGFAQISYDDWLANGSDVWVARLGAPIVLSQRESVARGVGVAAQGTRSYVFCDLRPHIISLGNDGALRAGGTYGTSEEDVREIFDHIASRSDHNHLLLYAHGGLVGEDSAIQKVADLRGGLLDQGVYPLSLIWATDAWTTLRNILRDAVSRRRPEGFLDDAKDFMLDRLDDALEPVARGIGGKALWDEMKENAVRASEKGGGLLTVLDQVVRLKARNKALKVHMVGHSAGSILLGGLVRAMGARGIPVETCTLWAPACTLEFYRKNYLPAIRNGSLSRFAVFTLTDRAEQDDHCANIYHKSLLYLVAHAFEETMRQPTFRRKGDAPGGESILGMQKWIEHGLTKAERPEDWVRSPNDAAMGQRDAARAIAHGSFDDDEATLKATLARILDRKTADAEFGKGRLRSAATNQAVRRGLMATG